ncbi:MAG: DUF4339 domain-containing protein [Deltaproteobacteria bacterium]|nr:MAG: DUF4339 domain-containing protein [Deltaproteobacteria bacterium]
MVSLPWPVLCQRAGRSRFSLAQSPGHTPLRRSAVRGANEAGKFSRSRSLVLEAPSSERREMRIECHSCGAKYQVADEKVIGKIFKVRCKKCGAMISVDGTNLGVDEAEEATRVYDMNQAGAQAEGGTGEAEAGIWYVVIEGEQKGPFTEAEVEERVSLGGLDADSFVWCDGMGDWERLADNDTFGHLFEGTAVAPSAAPLGGAAAGVGQVEAFPSGGYGAVSGGGAFSAAAGSARAGGDDIFSRASSSSDNSGRGDDGMVGARSENSVLFSLDSLTDVRGGGGTPKTEVPRTEESGLINLEALISTRNQQAGSTTEDDAGVGTPAAAASIPMGAAPSLPRPAERSKTAMIIVSIAAILVVALLAVILVLLLRGDDPAPAVAEAPTPATAAEAAGEAGAPEAAAAVDPSEDEGNEQQDADDGDEERVVELEEEEGEEAADEALEEEVAAAQREASASAQPSRTGTTTSSRTEPEPARTARREEPSRSASRTAPAEEETRSARRGGGDSSVDNILARVRGGEEEQAPAQRQPRQQAAASSGTPERLSPNDVRNTVRRYNARIARCKADDSEAGRYAGRWVIQPSGSVTNAAINRDNATGRCILGVIRDFSFPRFSGDPIPVNNFPFNIE